MYRDGVFNPDAILRSVFSPVFFSDFELIPLPSPYSFNYRCIPYLLPDMNARAYLNAHVVTRLSTNGIKLHNEPLQVALHVVCVSYLGPYCNITYGCHLRYTVDVLLRDHHAKSPG